MASYNRVLLVGNVTRDIELRHIASGTAVTELGLAVNEKTKKGNAWVDEVTFVDVTLWGRTAEVAAEFLTKGSPVLIEGKLRLESWEKDGRKFSKLKVVGESMQMLGSKPSSKPDNRGPSPSQQESAREADRERGIESPF